MGSDNVIAQTDALAREMGISPAEIERREAFLEFTVEDVHALERTSRQQIELREVDLSALVKELVAELRQQDPGRSADIVIGEGLVVKGDESLLRVMMQNLLGNAWKYTSARFDGRAEISFGSIASAGCDVPVFYVKDNGAGFDMAYAEGMFGLFQRLHGATEYPGEGIGLATVQRIIQRHSGRIWAQASAGTGATFYFTLWEHA